jgi:SAM-dependent methyltransferase
MSASGATSSLAVPDSVVWHDAEHGAYAADLELWTRLAAETEGTVVDLGAGTGRVTLELAGRGHRVLAVDSAPELLAALASRAYERGLDVETACGDVRTLDLPDCYPLILAPMQLLHIVGGVDRRRRALTRIADHLASGGRFVAALLDDDYAEGAGNPDPTPDVRQIGDWVFSSQPTEIRITNRAIVMRRRRQLVAPDGTLTETHYSVSLDRFSMAGFDADVRSAGMRVVGAEMVPSSLEYEDSIAMTMERADA